MSLGLLKNRVFTIAVLLLILGVLVVGVFSRTGIEQQDHAELPAMQESPQLLTPQPNSVVENDQSNNDQVQDDGDELSEESKANIDAQIAMARKRLEALANRNQQKQNQIDETIIDESTEQASLLEAELSYLVEQWRASWEAGHIDDYLSYYSHDFKPENNRGLDEWRKQRRSRVTAATARDIKLQNFKVTSDLSNQEVTITFEQNYRSTSYQEVSQKKLVVAKREGEWKIISESEL